MVVQHNISAMNANRYYGINNKALAGSLEKLSSGYAINRAGDNAAGLAVSEKMRAQIGGLTQASKNAEDGISMVQTFEGALQETDSILQRMRTLAVQSANGSYSDDVDRDAIQLEFDQLNDELNQIADTDFNGTVMLNGGTMADGVHAVGGTIDYANKRTQVTDATLKALQSNYETAGNAMNAARADYASGKYDYSSNGEAPEWNTVDNSGYNQGSADKLWVNMGYSKNAGSSNTNKAADTTQADTIDITFKYNASTKTWTADSATAKLNGDTVGTFNSTDLSTKIATAKAVEDANSGLGGFMVDFADGAAKAYSDAGDGTSEVAGQNEDAADGTTTVGKFDLGNAIFDSTKVTDGCTVTLTYKNSAASSKAPTNIGMDQDTYVNTCDGATAVAAPTIDIGAALDADSKMTEAIDKALTAMEGAKFTFTYDNDADFAEGEVQVNGKSIAIGTVGEAEGTAITDKDGNTFYAISSAAGAISFTADKEGTTVLATVTAGADAAGTLANGTAKGVVSGKLSISDHSYNAGTGASLTVGDDPNLEDSTTATNAINKAQEALNTAANKLTKFKTLDPDSKQDWETIKSMYAEAMSSSGNKVSVSDNFDNSTATLTYTNSMDLQVGARSKDMVQFTMNYSSKGLGDLESNLNCSAREGGLETAKLSLRTSEDANAAIDKIDNAINKVNMVRATFGAVQNRLEHKINTLDTNNENLTAAESRIRDTQMDKEMMKFTSSQILSQASQSMLAQANSLPQGVLQLLG